MKTNNIKLIAREERISKRQTKKNLHAPIGDRRTKPITNKISNIW
jgi:hypothetical protein